MNWYPAKPRAGGAPFGSFHTHLCTQTGWQQEPKWDGVRVIARGGAQPSCTSRTGKPVLFDSSLALALRELDEVVLDGELMPSRSLLWVFDLPDHEGTLIERRAELEQLPESACIRVVPLLEGVTGYALATGMGAEGVVFKQRSRTYPRARRPGGTTRWWWKIK